MDYTVSGSKESELLHKFNKEYMALRADINTLSQQYGEASKAQQNELKKQYVSLYNTLKRNQIAFIVENKATLASIYALYQRLPGERYLSNENSDILYYRSVLEAVEPIYPTSPFVRRLKKDVERMEASIALLQSVEVCSYPELKGSDMFGKEQSLSSLAGNVILVDFWSAEMGNNNILNAELKELYKRYEAKGFRVYQVSADTSKAIWITAVQEQALPWVSVCDFGGANSPMLRAYNVKKLPSNYLIDRNGNIVAKDLYGEALKRELAKIFK
jgi:peroxiredoxin